MRVKIQNQKDVSVLSETANNSYFSLISDMCSQKNKKEAKLIQPKLDWRKLF